MQGLIDKFSSNFIVAAFIPSLAFVTAAQFLFWPIIPQTILSRLTDILTFASGQGLLPVLILAAVVGFTLSSSLSERATVQPVPAVVN
ncbi:MAG TPA: hypothetical protein VJ793_20950 [Anaerolineae bacterium]|nr:hypothetical protein [Anaerolineae bacterium]